MTRPTRAASNYLTVVLIVWAALLWIVTQCVRPHSPR